MNWFRTLRVDDGARILADRHYSRQTPGAREFSRPARNLTLVTFSRDAVWVTSWPKLEFVKHGYGDCWECTIFRNEGSLLSSELVEDAVAATRAYFGDPPAGGFLTFVDPKKVRRKRDPGRCFIKAGFKRVGATKRGLVALHMHREDLPSAVPAREFQLELGAAA